MSAARELGIALAGKLRRAADARWLTTGVVIDTSPLTVNVDGEAVAVTLMTGDYAGEAGDVVLVGVLRGGLASVQYVVFGTIAPAAPGPDPDPDPEVYELELWFGVPHEAGSDSTHLNEPSLMRIDADDNIYVAEYEGPAIDPPARIRKITPSKVATVALEALTDVAEQYLLTFDVDTEDDLFAGTSVALYRSTAGVVTTLAGTLGGTYGAAISATNANTAYFGDYPPQLRVIDGSLTITDVAGDGTEAVVDGLGTGASFNYIWDGVTDDDDNYWCLDWAGNVYLRKVTPAGDVTTEHDFGDEGGEPGGIFHRGGILYLTVRSAAGVQIVAYDIATGGVETFITFTTTGVPRGVVVDSAGFLYVTLHQAATGTGWSIGSSTIARLVPEVGSL